jgi:hypothetical protein
MTPGPVHYVLVPFPCVQGDRGAWRRAKPSYDPRPVRSKERPWPLKQEVPDAQRRAMVDEARRALAEGREALRAALQAA